MESLILGCWEWADQISKTKPISLVFKLKEKNKKERGGRDIKRERWLREGRKREGGKRKRGDGGERGREQREGGEKNKGEGEEGVRKGEGEKGNRQEGKERKSRESLSLFPYKLFT